MQTEKITVNDKDIWVTTEPVNIYNPESGLLEEQPQVIAFFRYAEPTDLIYGELLRDNNRKVILFDDHNQAIQVAKQLNLL